MVEVIEVYKEQLDSLEIAHDCIMDFFTKAREEQMDTQDYVLFKPIEYGNLLWELQALGYMILMLSDSYKRRKNLELERQVEELTNSRRAEE